MANHCFTKFFTIRNVRHNNNDCNVNNSLNTCNCTNTWYTYTWCTRCTTCRCPSSRGSCSDRGRNYSINR